MRNKQIEIFLIALTIAIWTTAIATTTAEAFWPFDQTASSQTPPSSTNQTNSSGQSSGSPSGQPGY